MHPPASPENDARAGTRRGARAGALGKGTPAALGVIAGFVLWAHLASGLPVFRSQVPVEPGWEKFRADYDVSYFGDDGQFVRAVQHGYNLVFYTYKYAPRFTRKKAGDQVSSCSACHTAEDLAYAFVNSDRFDPRLGKRISFEERIQWCYAASVDGFVPTIYDPAVRDIRLLARAVAHHLQIGEGALSAKR